MGGGRHLAWFSYLSSPYSNIGILLIYSGAQGRRSRLTATEVSTLCKLEQLHKDVRSKERVEEAEGGSVADHMAKLDSFLELLLA